ncbi:hypothetical protein KFV05_05085 [Macrococcoides canis]|uniref:hypothetical protein n=1 Tax=Macrococcoides canis TaxID=1855823 RepID=UPI0020B674B3|nr:hypothetical protein [Macrococcus canis]UTH03363.1 hypothetical protein KFV05_05085 [Macrococcus canis]
MDNKFFIKKLIVKKLNVVNNINEIDDASRIFIESSTVCNPDDNKESNESLIKFNTSFLIVPEELEPKFKNTKKVSDELKDILKELDTMGKISMEFLVEYNFDKNDTSEIRNILLSYIEPYFRVELDKLTSELGLPKQVLPMRFWEHED